MGWINKGQRDGWGTRPGRFCGTLCSESPRTHLTAATIKSSIKRLLGSATTVVSCRHKSGWLLTAVANDNSPVKGSDRIARERSLTTVPVGVHGGPPVAERADPNAPAGTTTVDAAARLKNRFA